MEKGVGSTSLFLSPWYMQKSCPLSHFLVVAEPTLLITEALRKSEAVSSENYYIPFLLVPSFVSLSCISNPPFHSVHHTLSSLPTGSL